MSINIFPTPTWVHSAGYNIQNQMDQMVKQLSDPESPTGSIAAVGYKIPKASPADDLRNVVPAASPSAPPPKNEGPMKVPGAQGKVDVMA